MGSRLYTNILNFTANRIFDHHAKTFANDGCTLHPLNCGFSRESEGLGQVGSQSQGDKNHVHSLHPALHCSMSSNTTPEIVSGI
mmetsp:Transcript_71524/g.163894  ORF Transcript_71524/g.163894 Transcript_71524/m.163894 type:complete len:84 (+) Transcript_71524:388-639(+)